MVKTLIKIYYYSGGKYRNKSVLKSGVLVKTEFNKLVYSYIQVDFYNAGSCFVILGLAG